MSVLDNPSGDPTEWGHCRLQSELHPVLTESLVLKIEVQQVLIINFSNLNDGFVIQVLLQSCDLAGHELVGFVLVLAPGAQQVVSGCHLSAGHSRALSG